MNVTLHFICYVRLRHEAEVFNINCAPSHLQVGRKVLTVLPAGECDKGVWRFVDFL